MIWKALLLYGTFATIVFFFVAFESIVLSMWFLPYILFIVAEFWLCNRFITWEEAKLLLLIEE